MAHITFIHGIGNKPRAERLLHQWRVALLDDDGLDLDGLGVTASMGYWADILYPAPTGAEAGNESTSLELQEAATPQDADLSWVADAPLDEQEFVAKLGLKVGLASLADPVSGAVVAVEAAGAAAVPGAARGTEGIVPGSALEAVPLPGWLTRRLMKVFLRDVHHYLYDASFEPRPGERFRVRRDVRSRALAALADGAARPGPHVVVSHSLGTVIAYDVLIALADAPRVDALITLGSPLGISEVHDALAPPWTARDGWPTGRLGEGAWVNVADRLDPVCGPDPSIADEYRRAGEPRVHDVHVSNPGSWRHGVTKYLRQSSVRRAIASGLAIPW
jgi:hypothetical protein